MSDSDTPLHRRIASWVEECPLPLRLADLVITVSDNYIGDSSSESTGTVLKTGKMARIEMRPSHPVGQEMPAADIS